MVGLKASDPTANNGLNVFFNLEISLKNKASRRSTLILGVLLFTTALLIINISQITPIKAEFIYSGYEYEKFTIEELENGETYEITITYDDSFYDYDIGFAIYTHESFKDKYKVLTQDDLGFDFEVANYTATDDGDVYLAVWINDDVSGFVDISVTNTDTLESMTVSTYFESIWYSLRWLWIFLGIFFGIVIIMIILFITLVAKATKKHAAKVKDALARGISLPRYGRKKDKCPFCNVKLPPDSIVQCPYCGAPITDE